MMTEQGLTHGTDSPPAGARPFWSVMIPVYNSTKYLARTLESVLEQNIGPDAMQIEVIDGYSSIDLPEPLVKQIAGDRVDNFRHSQPLSMAANWNSCIERARGEWVHILHSDDYVLPGFYSRLEASLKNRQDVGAAFTRWTTVDPDGHILALTYGFTPLEDPVHYTRELRVVGLGHVLLTVADTQRAHDFYTGVLGFRLSDWVNIDEHVRLCFLRCNERHHSLAFAPCMPGKSPRLQHVMFEVQSLDDVMRSYHFLRLHNAPIGMGPGRHPNCQTVHVYVQTPGGFAVELGWGHRRLDDTHEPIVYPAGTPVDVWGGNIQSSEFELG